MKDVSTIAGTGVLDSAALAELRASFRGDVIEPGVAGYDDARVVFNGMFDRRPAVILRPGGTADVIRAVGLAKLSGLPLAIRGGGHSLAGFSLVDGGIVIDMRGMKGIRVDPRARTVRAQAGLDWGAFDRETQAFGLATTGGRVTTTGIAGFTTGSGSGWLERKLGLAADNLISVDVVTADGEVVTATEDENADLLWGIRGGGGNFGVVTELEFRLEQVGPLVHGGLFLFDPAKSVDVLRTWRDVSETAPEGLGWALASVVAPPEPFVPEEWHFKRMIGVLGMLAGESDETANALVAPLRAHGPAVALWQQMPYTAFQAIIDPFNPYGRRNYWRIHNLADASEPLIDTFVERAETIPSPFTAFLIIRMGGKVAAVGENDTALGGRNAPFNVHLNAMWEGVEGDEQNIGWVKETSTALAPYTTPGMPLNFYTEIGDAELETSYGAKLLRLQALKAKYDPANLFHLNQNIRPAA
jgi:FAD/FMN-containing dehydrogenase